MVGTTMASIILKLLLEHDCILIERHRIFLRGCSYGGELARLGGLARVSEISPSLRNFYKNIKCSYEK